MFDAVCLASGGLDSVVCLRLLQRQNIASLPLFINYGQRNLKREQESLIANVKQHKFSQPKIVNISGFGKTFRTGLTDRRKRVLEDAFTPNRNLVFLTIAASLAYTKGASTIVLGFLAKESAIFPDQTDAFLDKARIAIIESLGVNMEIVCPLRDFTKQEVVRLSMELGVKRSYSCHSGSVSPCGKCIACLEYGKGN